MRKHATPRQTPQKAKMGRNGLEPKPLKDCKSKELAIPSKSGGAESGADLTDLAKMVEIWPKLPDSIKTAIMTIVQEIGQEEGND